MKTQKTKFNMGKDKNQKIIRKTPYENTLQIKKCSDIK